MASQPYHKPNLSYSGHTAKEPSTYSATFLQFNIHLFSTKSEKQKKKQMQYKQTYKKHRNHSKFKVIAPKNIQKYGFSYVNLSRLSAF